MVVWHNVELIIKLGGAMPPSGNTATQGAAMGIFSRFEGKMEDTFEGAADKMFDAPISPVQIAKKAEKQMRREKMVGAGKQYAPTLYTVLVNPDDDRRLFGYYPTLAGETETYLAAKASEQGLMMDGQPLVRFIVDEGLKHGKFDVIAEAVAAPIISQLRNEEMQRYGLSDGGYGPETAYPAQQFGNSQAAVPAQPRYDQRFAQQAPANDWNQPHSAPQQGEYTYEAPQAPAGGAAYGAAPAAAAAGFAAGAAAQAAPAPAAAAGPAPSAAKTMVFTGNPDDLMQQRGAAAVGHARLIDTATNRPYELSSARITIGRESRNNIAIPDINVSRTHAELTLTSQGVWTVTDLGSTNGTYVNGRAIASQPLSEGDHISIGTTDLVFTLA